MYVVPEMPEKEMADGLILQGSTEKEFPELAIKVGLKLEHLHQLKQIHRQHLITAVQVHRSMQYWHNNNICLAHEPKLTVLA